MEDGEQRRPEQFVEDLRAAVDGVAEDRLPLVEPERHPGVLGALAGKQERHARPAAGPRLATVETGAGAAGEGVELGADRLPAVTGHGEAVLEVVAAGPRREADVRQLLARRPGAGRPVAGRQLPQRRLAPRRDREDVARPLGRLSPGRGQRRLLQQDVRVGAPEPEAVHSRQARRGAAPPSLERGRDLQWASLEPDLGVQPRQVDLGIDLLVLEAERHLDHARDAGGRLEVADVRLERAEQAAVVRGALRPHDLRDGTHLRWVADRRARPVRLEVAELAGIDAGAGQGLAHHALLRLGARDGQRARPPVLVRRGAANQGMHVVAVAERVREPLEQHHAAALRAHVAVGARVEALAAAVRGQHLCLGRRDRGVRRDEDVHAGGEGDIALAAPDALASEVQGDEGRRAGRVDRHARALQVKQKRQAVGGDAVRVARPDPTVEPLPPPDGVRRAVPVVERVLDTPDPDEDPGLRAGERGRGDARRLQRLPAHLQQDPLLRIHAARLPPGDPEELRVELVDPVERAHPARMHLPRPVRRVVELVHVPAVRRDLPDRVPPLTQQLTQVRDAPRSREPACHSDDCDRRIHCRRP